jgi:hypothetical protein
MNFKKLKQLSLLLFLLVSLNGVSQKVDSLTYATFEGKKFVSKLPICLTSNLEFNPQTNSIQLFSQKKFEGGNTFEITFTNGKFNSIMYGECGMECRANVIGSYSFKGASITLFVNSIEYYKKCSGRPAENINKPAGDFTWKKNSDGSYTLSKIETSK